jgi:hypothetical protein
MAEGIRRLAQPVAPLRVPPERALLVWSAGELGFSELPLGWRWWLLNRKLTGPNRKAPNLQMVA